MILSLIIYHFIIFLAFLAFVMLLFIFVIYRRLRAVVL